MEGYAAKQRNIKIVMHVVLIIMSFIMLVPFAWMILTALKTNQEAISVSPFYILPHSGWHWENFGKVWQSYNLFSLILVQMMIPAQIFIIPQYLMVSKLGMLNSMFGLVFPGLVTAFGTYLLKTGYEGLPKDLEEAAMIDGCNVGQRFLFIMMPLTQSSMVSLGIFTAVFAFKDLMWPMIVCTNADTTTLSAGLAKMQGQYGSEYPTMMAAATLAVLPMIVIYVIFQKQFVEGIATSGGKL